VREGKFHIYAVDHIDMALELLTGYTIASVDRRVKARVEELQQVVKSLSAKGEERDEK